MTWIDDTQKALRFIENNLTSEITPEEVADHVFSSSTHFQRTFGIVTGFSVGEYIRLRRLSIAGQELREGKHKVIDVALKYGYGCVKIETTFF